MSDVEVVTLVHPLTGEVLDPSDEKALRAALRSWQEWRNEHYIQPYLKAREIQGVLKVDLPRARYQTDKQQQISRCPRCGEPLEDGK